MRTKSKSKDSGKVDTEDHKRISFTADHHTYWRTIGRFPFAQDIEDAVNGRASFEKGFGENANIVLQVLPAFEARCRATNMLIRKYIEEKGIRQILSFAAGMEQRGIEFASTYPDLTYVETDISDVFETKKDLADRIFSKHTLPNRKGLYFEMADALSLSQLRKAASHFSIDKEILIVNEGMLAYYSEEENRTIARNVHSLLSSFDGYWATPDPTMSATNRKLFFAHLGINGLQAFQEKVSKKTGRNFDEKGFKDDSHALSLYESEGFSVKRYYRKDLGYSLTTLDKAGLDKITASKLDELLKERFAVWVMTPK